MTEIKLLMQHIEEELDDACKYAKLAVEYRDSDSDMAELFYQLSCEEMTHMKLLHNNVVSHIESYKRAKGDLPNGMKQLYEYLHKRDIERAEKVAALQGLCRA